MPRNKEIKKALVIGSGPIVIGQAGRVRLCGYTGMSFFERRRTGSCAVEFKSCDYYDGQGYC